MRSMIVHLAVFLWVLVFVPVATAGLQVGDPAPPFGKNIEWLKGRPIDPTRDVGKGIYVVEFWAVWCTPCVIQIPHTTELQKKLQKHGVHFVAMTSPGWQRQRLEDVRRFVQSQGDAMGYTVGFDRTEQTYDNYMTAAGANGIPYAFIIGKDGRIAWQGHPNGNMERVLEQVIAGTFDVAAAAAAAEVQKKLDALAVRFNRAAAFRQWEEALAALDASIALDSANEQSIEFSLHIVTIELKDRARARSWVEAYVRDHADSAAGLTVVARTLMEFPELGDRHPDLSLAAAAAACAADAISADALQVHARALHQVGKIDQAIEWQEKAVVLADDTAKDRARRALEFYKTCKRLAKL